MAAYTFELIRRGEAPLISEKVEISDPSTIWCQVEAFALRMHKSQGAFIRVIDEKGQTLVRAGVATALASISKCPCRGCPLKDPSTRQEAKRAFSPAHVAELSPCYKRGSCSCEPLPGAGALAASHVA
jgi:hypothetical protein